MDFFNFFRNTFFNFPTNMDMFLENPYPVLVIVFAISLILKGKIGFLVYFLISLIIFMVGLFYGIINPVSSDIVGIVIFAFCSLVAIGLVLFKILVKNS